MHNDMCCPADPEEPPTLFGTRKRIFLLSLASKKAGHDMFIHSFKGSEGTITIKVNCISRVVKSRPNKETGTAANFQHNKKHVDVAAGWCVS